MNGLTDDMRNIFRTAFECFPYNYQKVNMKAGETSVRELSFDWKPGDSPIYISIENSVLELILTE